MSEVKRPQSITRLTEAAHENALDLDLPIRAFRAVAALVKPVVASDAGRNLSEVERRDLWALISTLTDSLEHYAGRVKNATEAAQSHALAGR